MTAIAWVIRVLAAWIGGTFMTVGFTMLLRFYEAQAQDAARGVFRPVDRFRLAEGIGAWARESGLAMALAVMWPLGVLPRGRLRSGSWLKAPDETRWGNPVLLVPGYAMNRSCMRLLAQRLEESGRPALAIDFPYNRSIESLAETLAAGAMELKAATGSQKIDLVCHSRGGIVAHWWIQMNGGGAHVDRVVTLGSAFSGTKIAGFGIGPSARQMMPGSELMKRMAATPLDPQVTFYAVNGGSDSMMLPPGVDELPAPGRNIRLTGLGHSGLLMSAAAWKQIHLALRRATEDEAKITGFEDETTEQAAERAMAGFGTR